MATPYPLPRRTLFCRDAALFILLGATVMVWPALIHGGNAFTMPDSLVYLDQGERIWALAREMAAALLPAGPETGAAPAGPDAVSAAAADAGSVRSLPYAIFAGVMAPLGTLGLVWVQMVMVMALLWAALGEAFAALPPLARLGTAVLAATLTFLPFIGSFAMPDVLGGVIVLYALLLVHGIERFGTGSQILLAVLALVAIAAHYGNIPFAAALLLGALILRAVQGGFVLRAALIAGGACAAAVGGNIALGFVAFDETSVTPRRFPILLARSIEDGPARWHLQEACGAGAPYALCDYWGADIPDNVGDALWGSHGMEMAPPETAAAIRDQELQVLWAAFRAYPAAQVASLGGNAAVQLARTGLGFATVDIPERGPDGRRVATPYPTDPMAVWRTPLGLVQKAIYLAALAGLAAAMVLAPRGRGIRTAAGLILFAMLVNAAIFGGLSAPSERYQARVAWIPVLFALIWVQTYLRRQQRAPTPENATV